MPGTSSVVQGSFGAFFKISVSSVLTVVSHIVDFTFPEQENVLADITAFDSPSGYAQWIATGIKRLNSFKVTVVWSPDEAVQQALLTAFNAGTAANMSVGDAIGYEAIAFTGIVQKIGRIAKLTDGYKCEITIQPTGSPTLTTT